MSRIIERALSIINDNLKDQTTSFADPISIKPMARGGDVKGRLLQDEYPTHYLPHVGRQVMADGGSPVKGFEGRVSSPPPVEEPVAAEGVEAYHGSPHEFEDFDISKIGTGEGAQVYGHGLYFAGNENVAKYYRDSLTDPDNVPLHFKGKPVDTVWNDEISDRWKDVVKKLSKDHEDDFQTVMGNLSQINNMSDLKHIRANLDRKQNNILDKVVLPELSKPEIGSGHMYEVRIDAHPEKHLLDWDKPLSEQHPEVKKALKESHPNALTSVADNIFQMKDGMGRDRWFTASDDTIVGNPGGFASKADAEYAQKILNTEGPKTAGEWLKKLGSPQYQSEKLSKAGIRGIRYLDAGSRGQDEQSGSHNYVIFDPKHIKTVRRYAEGGGIKAFAFGNSVPHLEQASDMIETHDDIQLSPDAEAIDEMPNQAFNSAKTSRNQIPALFNSPAFERNKGSRNLDYGGGAFDKGSEYLAQEHGVDSQVYDPFNRSKEHNDIVLKGFKDKPADTATVANVLNVIAEPEARLHVIKQVHQHIKPDGKAYFTVYEGDGKDKNSGNSRMTRDGWQENRPTHSYVEEIKQVFPDVRLSGKTIIASKKPAKAYGGSIPGPKLTEENADDFARRLIAWTFATAPLFHRATGGSVIDDPLDVLSKLRR